MLRSVSFVVLLYLFMTPYSHASDCKINPEYLSASYIETLANSHGKTKKRSVKLTRTNVQVGIEYSDNQIAELWEKTKNNRLHLVRFYTQDKRGIEYQPEEVSHFNKHLDWSEKRQLLSSQFIKSMTLETAKGENCEKVESYSLKSKKGTYQLEWLTNQRLIKVYTITTPKYTAKWELQQVSTNVKEIRNYFATLSGYQTTDYIDIGDSESDPFMRKMINLGFVEHGASGFYDSEGNQIGGHHHH